MFQSLSFGTSVPSKIDLKKLVDLVHARVLDERQCLCPVFEEPQDISSYSGWLPRVRVSQNSYRGARTRLALNRSGLFQCHRFSDSIEHGGAAFGGVDRRSQRHSVAHFRVGYNHHSSSMTQVCQRLAPMGKSLFARTTVYPAPAMHEHVVDVSLFVS